MLQFENLLFPPIQAILGMEIPEFTPYILQILYQLLELRPGQGIPAEYEPFLPPLLQPHFWEQNGMIA